MAQRLSAAAKTWQKVGRKETMHTHAHMREGSRPQQPKGAGAGQIPANPKGQDRDAIAQKFPLNSKGGMQNRGEGIAPAAAIAAEIRIKIAAASNRQARCNRSRMRRSQWTLQRHPAQGIITPHRARRKREDIYQWHRQ